MFRVLVVHHVELWLEAFALQLVKILFVCIEYAFVIKSCNRRRQNRICLVMVQTFLYALNMLLSSNPAIGVAKIAFASL